MLQLMSYLGLGESVISARVGAGASTFVVAYAVHKVFAPARIAVTLTTAPLIVKKLRSAGVLKSPTAKKS